MTAACDGHSVIAWWLTVRRSAFTLFCCVYAVVEVKTGDLSQVKDAPEYRPTVEEWKDPMAYVEKIRQEAENFGIAKIIPPAGWTPPYVLKDDFKFPTYGTVATPTTLQQWVRTSQG